MPNDSILAPDFKAESYWWDVARPGKTASADLDQHYDVAVIGSGLTGMHAALHLARAGVKVIVLDSQRVGEGASRRNAGFLGRVLKKSYLELKKRYGADHAHRVYTELNDAYQSTLRFVEREDIHCYAERCGRFVAATSAAHLAHAERDLQGMQQGLGWNYHMVAPGDVRSEMGSDAYFGGAVVPDLGSIHPGLYHQGVVRLALGAGVSVSAETPVTAMERNGAGHRLSTPQGMVSADRIVVATNGYTPRHLRWHARRVVPFTGFMAATEELPSDLLAELIPHRRTIIDSNTNIDFFRPAPDAPRLLFGGSTGSRLETTEAIAAQLHKRLTHAFPQLRQTRLSRVWSGLCAGTFDMMPHVGESDGVWYALGYNFAGVPMGTYLGVKIAQQILGDPAGETVFGKQKFPTLPFYTGNPWFVPLAMRVFDHQDRMIGRRGRD